MTDERSYSEKVEKNWQGELRDRNNDFNKSHDEFLSERNQKANCNLYDKSDAENYFEFPAFGANKDCLDKKEKRTGSFKKEPCSLFSPGCPVLSYPFLVVLRDKN